MRASERKALTFTLQTNKKHVEQRVSVLKRRIKTDNDELIRLLRQLSDIEQSLSYLEGD